MEYEIVIGLEIHAELKTGSKIFCGCKNEFGDEPNTSCCPVCLGMPGTLPVLNKKALEYAVKAGLAMNCQISKFSKMDRKNYFYPDMPKAYQISQYDMPICYDGFVNIETGDEMKRIGIERIHLEEDARGEGSMIDYNRCGVPLIEIVTRPDVRTPEEARSLFETVKSILEYTGVSDCRMQEGSIRADVNLSIRPRGREDFGIRTEMKNINSLRAVERAAAAEAKRQAEVLDQGGTVVQETRRWDDNKGESFSMRSKEEAMDYRYFPEPDLVPIVVEDAWISEIKSSIPELPQRRKKRYIEKLGIPAYDANLITMNKLVSDIFEAAAETCGNPKLASNWVMTELLCRVNEKGESVLNSGLTGEKLGEILLFLERGEITQTSANTVLDVLIETGEKPQAIIEHLDLKIQKDENLIAGKIHEILKENPRAVMDYAAGKEKAFGFLMGKSMTALKGKGHPALVRETLTRELQLYLK